jgi:hypothetical protein
MTRSIIAQSDAEELWIIAKSSDSTASQTEESPGSGTLMAMVEEKQVPMPLKHTDVRATVSGYIGSVEVVQQFLNPYSSKIEAVYVFPLPHNAAGGGTDLSGGKTTRLCCIAAHGGAAKRFYPIRREHRAGQRN